LTCSTLSWLSVRLNGFDAAVQRSVFLADSPGLAPDPDRRRRS